MIIEPLHPNQLSQNTLDFLSFLDETADKIRLCGQFSDELSNKLRFEFVPEQLRNTFAIEGIVLDPQVTRAKMQGSIIAESEKYNEATIENALKCVDMAAQAASSQSAATGRWLRQLHGVLMSGNDIAGQFRIKDVTIQGADFNPPNHLSVPSLIDDLCVSLETMISAAEVHPVAIAVWAHVKLAQIHPFSDGNGRTARFLQDYVLSRLGFFPVGVPAARRQEYYDSLSLADENEWDDIIELVADAELTILERTLTIAQNHTAGTEAIRRIVQNVHKKARNSDHMRFQLWEQSVNHVLDTLDLNVRELKKGLTGTDWYLRGYKFDPLPFDTWMQVVKSGWSRNVWLYSLEINHKSSKETAIKVILFAHRHDDRRTHDLENVPHGQVAIFLGGQSAREERYQMDRYSDAVIGLREIRFDKNGLVLYCDPSSTTSQFHKYIEQHHTQHVGSEALKWQQCVDMSTNDMATNLLEDLVARSGAS